MGVVEDFIQSENSKTEQTGKYSGELPRYLLAKDFVVSKQNFTVHTTTIRPSVAGQILAVFLLASGVFMWLMIFRLMLQKTMLPVTITGFLFVSCGIAALVWFYFLNPRFIYKITLNTGGIRLRDVFIPWPQLQDCLIMIKGWGKRRECRLVLFTSDKNIHSFHIGYLNISNEDLLQLIGQYRSNSAVMQ